MKNGQTVFYDTISDLDFKTQSTTFVIVKTTLVQKCLLKLTCSFSRFSSSHIYSLRASIIRSALFRYTFLFSYPYI